MRAVEVDAEPLGPAAQRLGLAVGTDPNDDLTVQLALIVLSLGRLAGGRASAGVAAGGDSAQ